MVADPTGVGELLVGVAEGAEGLAVRDGLGDDRVGEGEVRVGAGVDAVGEGLPAGWVVSGVAATGPGRTRM